MKRLFSLISSTFIFLFSKLISAIRFKEDSKIVTKADETLKIELIQESPRDGQKVSYTLHTIQGDEIPLAQDRNLFEEFSYIVPADLAGTGMAEIVARSDTGAECSTPLFIK